MIKPDSLRAALTAALPLLATNPENLRMWVDKGSVRARHSHDPARPGAFEWRYTLNVHIYDWTLHPALPVLAVNHWLAINQPDLLSGTADESYSFEADIIDAATIDLALELKLTEAVTVTPRNDGGFDLQHLAEDDPMLPGTVPLSSPAALLQQIWYQGDRIIPGPPLP